MMTVKEIREKGFQPTGATQYRLETMESEKKLTEFKALNKCVQMVGKPIPF